MNASTVREIPKNPWKDRNAVPKAKPLSIALAFIILTLCVFSLPFVLREEIAFTVMAVLIVYVVYAMRTPSKVAFILICTTLVSFSISIGTVFLCLIIALSTAAFLFTAWKCWYLTLIPFVAASASVFAVTRDWRLSLLPLAVLPAGILLAVATKRNERRTAAICYAAAGLLIASITVLGFLLWQGSTAMGLGIKEYIALLPKQFGEWMHFYSEQLLANLNTVGNPEATKVVEVFKATMDATFYQTLSLLLFYLIPAGVMILCNVIAFNAQMFLTAHYQYSGMEGVITKQSRTFTMSVLSAILYAVTGLVVVFTKEVSIFALVCQNLSFILMPGFCVRAGLALVQFLKRSNGGMRIVVLLMIGGLICCGPLSAISLMAFIGAYQTVMEALQNKMREQINKQGVDGFGSNGSDDDRDDEG